MSREILFRGKSIGYVGNFWSYGGLIQYDKDTFYIIENNQKAWDISHDGILIDPKTIGQYTGLTDKNGVKIFEGDLLNIHQTVNGVNLFVIMSCIGGYEVRYFYDGKPQREYEYSIYELLEIGIIDKELEVIGNIHDK